MRRFYRTSHRLWLLLVLLALATGPISPATAQPPIRMVGPHFDPYFFYDEQEELSGAIVELFSLIVDNAGLDWEGQLVPPRRIVRMLQTGEANASILVKNPIFENDPDMIRSEQPIAQMVLNIYYRSDFTPAQTIDDLIGQKVAVIHQYGYGGYLGWLEAPENAVNLTSVDRFDQAIQLLENKRADYLLLYDVNFAEGVERLGRPAQGLNHTLLKRVPLYLQISRKGAEDAENLLQRLEVSYRNLIATGRIRQPDLLPTEVIAPIGN